MYANASSTVTVMSKKDRFSKTERRTLSVPKSTHSHTRPDRTEVLSGRPIREKSRGDRGEKDKKKATEFLKDKNIYRFFKPVTQADTKDKEYRRMISSFLKTKKLKLCIITHLRFTRGIVGGVQFKRKALLNSVYDNVWFKDCTFKNIETYNTKFKNCTFTNCHFTKDNEFKVTTFEDCVFEDSKLAGITTSNTQFKNTHFRKCLILRDKFTGNDNTFVDCVFPESQKYMVESDLDQGLFEEIPMMTEIKSLKKPS